MRRILQFPIVISTLMFWVAGGAHAAAQSASHNTALWNLPPKGERLAVQGYDLVEYFSDGGGRAVRGSGEWSATIGGVVYRFSSEKNLEAFRKEPDRYLPAHGGWCSWAMRAGDRVDVDPTSFIVRDGRLFLFYKGWLGDTRAKWLAGDHANRAAEADRHWKRLSGEAPRTIGEKPAP